jgi:hypothetical protein
MGAFKARRIFVDRNLLNSSAARLPRLDAGIPIEPGRSLDAVYLRAAQAYMLISMPTGTSTIFGVFQVIQSSRRHSARTSRQTRT